MNVNKGQWYKNAYRRNVVDMHISDCSEEFLSQFDADSYVSMLTRTRAKSAVIYAHSHVGYCLYPTRAGKMHPNLRGRDIFGEMCQKCGENNIAAVGYMSLIFDTYAYDEHKDWAIVNADGNPQTGNGRYGVCCPNNKEYRDYTAAIAKEIVSGYELDGIRFDMTFWPGVCYCESCKKRYADETGGEMPKIINWHDSKWAIFQRSRESWLVEYAEFMTKAVRDANPEVTIEHQSSTFASSWGFGVNAELAKHSDFLQGDFYGGYVQGSTACKLFYNLTPNLPFGFETSSNESLADHTTMKSAELLKAKSYMAIANGGAFIFIDAIDPRGTLNPYVYDTMAKVFEETSNYEGYINGTLVQDVAVYLSCESKCSFDENGTDVRAGAKESPHVDGFFKASRALIKNHIPYGVITKKNLGDLKQYKAIILSNVLMMSDEEVAALRDYVCNGGNIYASGHTSLTDIYGDKHPDFMLSDVLGVSYIGETQEHITYFSPEGAGKEIFPSHYNELWPIYYGNRQILANKHEATKTLADMILPYTVPHLPRPFASIHSNPPGNKNGHPSITENSFGKGKAIYSAAQFETNESHDEMFASLVRHLVGGNLSIETAAPRQVEVLTYKNDAGYSVSFLSFQAEMPNLPIPSFCVKLKVAKVKEVKEVKLNPDGTKLDFVMTENGFVSFELPGFDTFANVQVVCEN